MAAAKDLKKGPETAADDEDEQPKENMIKVIFEIYTGKRKSVIPMATFVFLQTTCFLYSN